MAKSPKSRSRESRSQKSRTGATRWAQLGEKKRDNKQRVAEANKLKKAAVQEERKKKKEDVDASETVILQTPSGRSLRVLDVYGYGKCAMLVVWALYKITGGMPYDEVAAAVSPTGGITQELADELQRIREAVADVPDADLPLKDGEEALGGWLPGSFGDATRGSAPRVERAQGRAADGWVAGWSRRGGQGVG